MINTKRKTDATENGDQKAKKKKVQFAKKIMEENTVKKEIKSNNQNKDCKNIEKTKNTEFKNKKTDFKGNKPEFKGKKPDFKGKKPDFKGNNPNFKGKKLEYKGKKPEFKGKKTEYKGKNPKPNFKNKTDFKGKTQNTEEKPKWSEMKKEKKELRIVRRKAKATAEVFEKSHKAKMLSAQIQRKTVKQEFRDNACQELHDLLRGQYKSIALTHDLSRVIQVLLKHSPEVIRNEISTELLDIMVQMVQSKYAQHAVKRILKYGTDTIRHEVLKRFFGSIVTLAAHSISAPVLDYAYTEFATQNEKTHMQQEFYGDIYKNSKDDKVKTISDSYKDSPDMKSAILSSCKANVQRILDKNLHDSELFQSVLYDYMKECSAEDRAELISTLSPLIVPLSNSLPGVNAASMCVWQGTNKDKKTILKVVKEHAVSLSTHKTGYRLLLAIFDSVDDTVLVKKTIVSAIANKLKDIAKDHWGKMTLHWLVKPNDTAAFHPNLVKFLKDGAKSGTSKKDEQIRVAELREVILPALQKEIADDADFWLAEPTIMLLTTAIVSIESTPEMIESISKSICRPDWSITKDENSVLAVEDAGVHMCLKKLAALDKDRDISLGDKISGDLSGETLTTWLATNRGCFFLVKLIENNNENVADKIISKIKSHKKTLQAQSTPGAKLLLKKIE